MDVWQCTISSLFYLPPFRLNLSSPSLDVEDELTDMDEVLGPKNDDANSSSSGGSSPRSSLSPEEITQYPVEADYVVSSASVQANSDHSSPADSPVLDHKETQQANGEEIKENGHDTAVVDKESARGRSSIDIYYHFQFVSN